VSEVAIDGDDVAVIVEGIFTELLGLGVERGPTAPVDAGARQLTGAVRISGAWEGAVTVDCPYALAHRTAAAMLGAEPADEADVADALGEVANMAGGNIKALLPGPSELSLPVVTERAGPAAPASGVLTRLGFACQGLPLTITVTAVAQEAP
jgi:chemotaxis protein CheX